ncbi:MAG: RNase P modulator RnpM [Anaerolineae bacterium]
MASVKKKQPRRQKHVPQRTCVVCKDKMDKRDLLRIVNNPEEGITIDLTGKKTGRGAYVCTKTVCWDKVVETSILNGALRTPIKSEDRVSLKSRFEDLRNDMGSTA